MTLCFANRLCIFALMSISKSFLKESHKNYLLHILLINTGLYVGYTALSIRYDRVSNYLRI